MLTWFGGLGVLIKMAIVAAIVAAVAGAVWYIHHSIWKEGYNAATLKLQPVIDKQSLELQNARADLKQAMEINRQFEAEVRRLTDVTAEQQMSIDKFKADALAAEIKVRRALVEIAAKEKRYTKEIQRLVAIAAGPPITEGAYEEADSILRSLVRDRLFEHAGTNPAPAGGGSPQGGAGGSGGGSSVRQPG